jgi:uncharacterized membrane protein
VDWVLALLLFLHVGGAIVAFGPTFTFPILGPMAGREPQHVNFALRFQMQVARRLIVPLALFQGITGLLLVWRISFDLLTRGWLLVAIALYVFLLILSLGVGLPNLRRLIDATSAPPPAPAPGEAAPHGPPPHIAAMVARGRQVGMIQTVLIVVIVFLMVTKPF